LVVFNQVNQNHLRDKKNHGRRFSESSYVKARGEASNDIGHELSMKRCRVESST
jgi:uncharacterized protein (UPF0303 family)